MTQTVITAPDANLEVAEPLTAVLYLRVSSAGQMNKAVDPEGYSIPGQREACQRYAERLGTKIIGEFVEYGQSATTVRRGALQRLLAELPKLQPTYVIVYDLSRVARDDYDALWLLREIERHGSRLESTLERVDDSPAGKLLYTVMAGVNAFRSRGDGLKVKAGLERKLAEGGTVGLAPVGYINTRERIDGREVRTVALDPERARLVRLGFDAFATGEYSLTTLTELLDSMGLKTKETAKRPAKPLTRSGVYRLLRDRYYIGFVTRNGVTRPGRHPKLIDEDTFEKVQQLLVSRRLAGDRSHKHRHYLKGTLFCSCGRRLTWGRHRGNGGQYEYFCCLSNQAKQPRCGNRYMAADAVERAVEDYYRRVSLSGEQCEAIRTCVREHAEERVTVARKQSEEHTRRLRTLQDEQQKLLRLYYRKGVSEEVLIAEQARIDTERTQARKLVETATHETKDIFKTLKEALRLVGPDCHAAYLRSDPQARRLLNQAIFERLIVTPDGVEDEPQALVAELHRLANEVRVPSPVAKGRKTGRGHQSLGGHGSHVETMVRIVEQLSNPSPHLQAIFDALPDGPVVPSARSQGPAAPEPEMRRLGNRAVQDAVIETLAKADRPMSLAELRTAVEAFLGHPVSRNSVDWCLSSGSRGNAPRFERVSRGCYRLIRPT